MLRLSSNRRPSVLAAWVAVALLWCPGPVRAEDEDPEEAATAAAAEAEALEAREPEDEPPPPEEAPKSQPIEGSPVIEEEAAATGAPVRGGWQPPEPEEGGWDWLRTTSGEWLKGSLTRMRDRVFEFDSDEFDEVKVDQDDVAYFRFARPHTYRFRGREIFRGTAQQRDGVVRIRTKEGEIVERPAATLVSISRGAGGELERWSVDLGVGATVRSGNTDQTDITGTADIRRETAFTRLRLEYRGAWSRVDSAKTTNNHRLFTAYDWFVTWELFVTLPFLEFFTDEFQNIEGRYTPGAGVGYELIKNSRIEWDVFSGLAYQRTVFTSGGDSENDAAILASSKVEIEVTKDLDWDTSYQIQAIVTDFGKTNHHLESELSFDVWGPVDFDFTFIWDRIESPETQSSGNTPDSDDLRMVMGFSIDF